MRIFSTAYLSFVVPLAAACSQGSPANGSPDAAAGPSNPSALVAQCQALAKTFSNNCYNEYIGDALTPDTERVCIWNAYGQICQTGKTQLLVDSMNCFGQNPHCWTFSDPNDTAQCLATVHSAGESSAVRAFLMRLCNDCGGSSCDGGVASGQAEVIPYVSDSDLAALNACRGTACTNAAVVANCGSVPEVALFACK
jgi:hypothetical protein